MYVEDQTGGGVIHCSGNRFYGIREGSRQISSAPEAGSAHRRRARIAKGPILACMMRAADMHACGENVSHALVVCRLYALSSRLV